MGLSKFGPGGLRVVFNEDPDTPCMVYLYDASATFDCAEMEGEIEGYGVERGATGVPRYLVKLGRRPL